VIIKCLTHFSCVATLPREIYIFTHEYNPNKYVCENTQKIYKYITTSVSYMSNTSENYPNQFTITLSYPSDKNRLT